MLPTIDIGNGVRLLGSAQWLPNSGPLAPKYYHHLLCEIEALRQPGDSFVVPGFNEPFAFKRAHEIYVRLAEREKNRPPPDPATVAKVEADRRFVANADLAWSGYVRDHADLIELQRRGELSRDAVEYLGLLADDFRSPISDEPDDQRHGGRRAAWDQTADRLARATKTWRFLSPEDKARIPAVMQYRRLASEVHQLGERIAANSDQIAAIAARMDRLEAAAVRPICETQH